MNEHLGPVEKTLSSGNLRKRLQAFFDFAITNFCTVTPSRGCPITRGLTEIASSKGEGEGLSESAREAFVKLLQGVIDLIDKTLKEAADNGKFNGNPKMAATHLVTITRGRAVLARAFGDEKQLRKIVRYA